VKYLLEINEEHAKVIIEALDVFSRIHMGQLDIVAEQLNFSDFFNKTNVYDTGFKLKIDELKTMIGLCGNSHLGIRNKMVHEYAKIAFDIQQVIRHRLAWTKHPQGGTTVDFSKPLICGKLPLPKIYGEYHDR
jgi:hypothetical protein